MMISDEKKDILGYIQIRNMKKAQKGIYKHDTISIKFKGYNTDEEDEYFITPKEAIEFAMLLLKIVIDRNKDIVWDMPTRLLSKDLVVNNE